MRYWITEWKLPLSLFPNNIARVKACPASSNLRRLSIESEEKLSGKAKRFEEIAVDFSGKQVAFTNKERQCAAVIEMRSGNARNGARLRLGSPRLSSSSPRLRSLAAPLAAAGHICTRMLRLAPLFRIMSYGATPTGITAPVTTLTTLSFHIKQIVRFRDHWGRNNDPLL